MVEFIGIGVTHNASEVNSRSGGVFDRDYTHAIIEAHESNGWDGMIFHYNSATVDPSIVAAYASSISERVKLIVAVRPNTCVPTYMAKKLATLDTIAHGRMRMHVIAGGYGAEQAAEGDYMEKDKRYDRVGEFIDVCRKVWTEKTPFDHDGEFYSLRKFYADVRCTDENGLLVSTAGTSDAALRMAAKRSDRHAVWGLPFAETRELMSTLRRYCDEIGRDKLPEVQMQFRPVLGDTTADAHARANSLMDRMKSQLGGWAANRPAETAGAQKALEVLAKGEWHDSCFWAGPVNEVSGAGNSTALVGTPEQLAETLCVYHELGIDAFGLNDYDTLDGSIQFGQQVIPLVRAELSGSA